MLRRIIGRERVPEERRQVRLGEREIDYLLKRSPNRRRATLSVDDRGLVVSVAWRTSERYLSTLLQDSTAWIVRKLDAWQAHKPPTRAWRSGDLLDYLGRQLRMELEASSHCLTQLRDGGVLAVALPHPERSDAVRAAVVEWYRRHARVHLHQRLEHFAGRLGLDAPRLFLSNATTRWGSCNVAREIRLNWRLMQASTQVIDYVVAHEVAHLLEMNHSRRFWELVGTLCPESRAARAELGSMSQHYMAL